MAPQAPRGSMPLLLVLSIVALSSSAIILGATARPESSYQKLKRAILLANNNAWGGSVKQMPHTVVKVVITSDIIINRRLPQLHPNATALNIISRCRRADGTPRKCVISGEHKFGVFRTLQWVRWTKATNCSLFVNNFIFTRINGSVFENVYCTIKVGGCAFLDSKSWFEGGTVIRQLHAVGTTWTVFPPAFFYKSLFRNLTARVYDTGTAVVPYGSVTKSWGFNRIWFYDSTFWNCSGIALDTEYGAHVTLVRSRIGEPVYLWDGTLDDTVRSILAWGGNATVINSNIKPPIVLHASFMDTFSKAFDRSSYATFCGSTIKKIILGYDGLFTDVTAKGTLVLCNTTPGQVRTEFFDEEIDDSSPWKIKRICPSQCG